MQLKKKWIIPVRSTVFLSLVGAIIGFGVYGCKKEEPVSEDTAPTESIEPVREDTSPKQSIEQKLAEEKLYKQTKIAFTSIFLPTATVGIYVMNADGSELKRLTYNNAFEDGPSWSPDGTKIAFASKRDGNLEIYVMNADGSEQINLTNNPARDSCPCWSPDGKKIAFASERDGNFEIYIMNADGSEQKRLTSNPGLKRNLALDHTPSWSPDGKKIAFHSLRDGNFEIYVMNADGSEQINLTNNPAGDSCPCWSPDGKKIAFGSRRDRNSDIYVMNADGSEQKRLTNNPGRDWGPSWSPDGKKIAFESSEDIGNTKIYVMNTDGSGRKNLTNNLGLDGNNPVMDGAPSWSPFLPLESLPKESVSLEERLIESAVKVMRGIEENRLSQEEMDKKGKELDEAWRYLIAKGDKSAIYLKSELNKLRQKEEKDDHFALGAARILWQIRGIKEANTIAQIWETSDQLVNYRYVFMTAFMAARERNPKVIPMLKATLREKQGTFMTGHALNLVWPLTQEWIWGTYGSLGLPELEKVLLKSNIPAELESAMYTLSHAQYVKVLPRVRELINHKNDDVKARALKSLGVYGHPDDYNTLIKALSSKNPSVIKGSLRGLNTYQNIDAAPLISPLLNHNDKEISKIAFLTLGQLPCIESLDAIYKYSNTTSDSMIKYRCQSIIRRYLRRFKTNWREYSKKDVEEKKKLFDDYWKEYEGKYIRKLFDRKLSRKEFLKTVKEWKRNNSITGGKYEWVEDRHILDIATPDDINLLIDVQAHILERLSDEALYEIFRLREIITRLGRRRYRK